MFREWFENHRSELIVGIIGAGISMALALAVTGDFNEAAARANRR